MTRRRRTACSPRTRAPAVPRRRPAAASVRSASRCSLRRVPWRSAVASGRAPCSHGRRAGCSVALKKASYPPRGWLRPVSFSFRTTATTPTLFPPSSSIPALTPSPPSPPAWFSSCRTRRDPSLMLYSTKQYDKISRRTKHGGQTGRFQWSPLQLALVLLARVQDGGGDTTGDIMAASRLLSSSHRYLLISTGPAP